ncbi:hypothetical protein BST14_17340 [Mycobacterium arosiense ATCC BAA-1401 = DSM 45069]|uniref:LysR substrate-binding domain-containing protein n=1 Tax=Mycobacterium arosiense ATCC BAA-1401 = DSM 45069 TaxID=1265311 RepID=A0A1W9ZD08_MYCAI|nr:hypothetical protein BST14_17340 [Mycobacterium arosiense ATCC BAA-1401 = DSM 45069]
MFGPGPLQDSTLIARKLFDLNLLLCASTGFVNTLPEPFTDPLQLNTLPFIDFGFCGPQKLAVTKLDRRFELAPLRTEELKQGTIVPVLPDWTVEPLAVHMIYPFELSFSTLISAFYDTACQIIVENIARAQS